jgi:hypothetical protein
VKDIDTIDKDANKDKVSHSVLLNVKAFCNTNAPLGSLEAKTSDTTRYPQADKGNGTVRERGSSKSD